MKTWQDYQKEVQQSGDNPETKMKFIADAIADHKGSQDYLDAVEAQEYYAKRNRKILQRLNYMQKNDIQDSKFIFHKICNGFFPKAVKQLANYLAGNGVTLEDSTKEKLGIRFDNTFQRMLRQALVDGVNWGYWQQGTETKRFGLTTKKTPGVLHVFRATEFVPIPDKFTSDMMMGIRFYQLDKTQEMGIELFEIGGITKYEADSSGSNLVQVSEITPYIYKNTIFGFGEQTTEPVDSENNPQIPVFPLYANDLHKTELDPGIKSMIDAIDFISSDLADGITLIEGIYSAIKNYGGNDVADLVVELQKLKAFAANEDANADISMQSIEIPYQAKQIALDYYNQQLFKDFMVLDMDSITGGSLTNVAIKAAMADLDLKADGLCEQAEIFIINLLSLMGIEEVPQFKRRTLTNDEETISNVERTVDILENASDALREWAAKVIPIISDEDRKELLDGIAIDEQEQVNDNFPLDEPGEREEEP